MTKRRAGWDVLWSIGLVALVACGKSKSSDGPLAATVAVGTYVGGGSMVVGPDTCTYVGEPGMFEPAPTDLPASDKDRGPRFILAPGKITMTCGDLISTLTAVVPNGAIITGPSTLKVGGEQAAWFEARFTRDGKEIEGRGQLAWSLGPDCEGVATFGPVMGSQDTGGPDRTRRLVTTKAGTCTVKAQLSTGNESYPKVTPVPFKIERPVTIQ